MDGRKLEPPYWAIHMIVETLTEDAIHFYRFSTAQTYRMSSVVSLATAHVCTKMSMSFPPIPMCCSDGGTSVGQIVILFWSSME
jgi:hypothetical protein